VAAFLGVDRHAVLAWRRAFAARGALGLEVSPGRGRRSQVDEAEVLNAIQQSPRAFGLTQERWTLAALRRVVPSLRPLRSLRSVQYVLERLGWSPKRGQYRRVSPDPEYEKKNNTPPRASGSRAKTRKPS
jgi:transposase